ncbi:hypothetical protein RF11_07733 [Thelohanellus kitauei]|uniref:Uncharacterized protein n=1 Tax=Thelohanellus kitauei TaxID=669202 RepID=A0A0C2MSW6_THEKT|nr:hypothetical protein RF11_07733 [Thelohanellus kitauei]
MNRGPICNLDIMFKMILRIDGDPRFNTIKVTGDMFRGKRLEGDKTSFTFNWADKFGITIDIFHGQIDNSGKNKIDLVSFNIHEFQTSSKTFLNSGTFVSFTEKSIIFPKKTIRCLSDHKNVGVLRVDILHAVCTFYKIKKHKPIEKTTIKLPQTTKHKLGHQGQMLKNNRTLITTPKRGHQGQMLNYGGTLTIKPKRGHQQQMINNCTTPTIAYKPGHQQQILKDGRSQIVASKHGHQKQMLINDGTPTTKHKRGHQGKIFRNEGTLTTTQKSKVHDHMLNNDETRTTTPEQGLPAQMLKKERTPVVKINLLTICLLLFLVVFWAFKNIKIPFPNESNLMCMLDITFKMILEFKGQKFEINESNILLVFTEYSGGIFECQLSKNSFSIKINSSYSFDDPSHIEFASPTFDILYRKTSSCCDHLTFTNDNSFYIIDNNESYIFPQNTIKFKKIPDINGTLRIDNLNAVCTYKKTQEPSTPVKETTVQPSTAVFVSTEKEKFSTISNTISTKQIVSTEIHNTNTSISSTKAVNAENLKSSSNTKVIVYFVIGCTILILVLCVSKKEIKRSKLKKSHSIRSQQRLMRSRSFVSPTT